MDFFCLSEIFVSFRRVFLDPKVVFLRRRIRRFLSPFLSMLSAKVFRNLRSIFLRNLTSKPDLPRESGVRTESFGTNFFLPASFVSNVFCRLGAKAYGANFAKVLL